jgi:tetratricopeptide (TPR) repeat protein
MYVVRELRASQTSVTDDSRHALELCAEAGRWEEVGEYGEAARCLAPLWRGVGFWPSVEGLEGIEAAEVLLQAGSLTAWLGDAAALKGVQDEARNMLDAAATIFRAAGDHNKVVRTRIAVGMTYWREGAFESARAVLNAAYQGRADGDTYLRLVLASALVEVFDGQVERALKLYKTLEKLFAACENHALRARYHNTYGLALKRTGDAEGALKHYKESLRAFDLLGNLRLQGNVQNNIGTLHLQCGRYEEAHRHLSEARKLFEQCGDKGSAGQVDDSIAQAYLAENRPGDAEPVARRAVEALEGGDGTAFLIEALETHSKALARLRRRAEASDVFSRAAELTAAAFGPERASKTALLMVEELSTPAYLESGLPFDEAVHKFEEGLLREALQASNNSMKEAALRLGMPYYSLVWMLNNRHRKLLNMRSPVVPRSQSVSKRGKPKKKAKKKPKGKLFKIDEEKRRRDSK